MLSQGQFLVNETSDNNTVKNGYRTALRRSKHTKTHSQNDTKWEKQPPERGNTLFHDLFQSREFFTGGRVVSLMCNNRNNDHHRDCHQNTRNITSRKRTTQGNLCNQGKNDQVYSRRDNRCSSRGSRCDRCGEGLGVTSLLHLRNQHLGLHRTVCVGRTGTSAHQHTKYYVYLCQTAFHMTGQHFREIHHLVTDAAIVHDGTSHNEKWNR